MRSTDAEAAAAAPAVVGRPPRSSVRTDVPLPGVPTFERLVFRDLSLDYLWPYLNPQMLYGKHMGLHGNVQKRLCAGRPQGDRP